MRHVIIVATHVNFSQAWRTLKSTFLADGVDMRDVVVVVGGSDREDITVPADGAPAEDQETYIRVPFDFYEYVAVYGVHRFIDHPRVRADAYLLVHDTSYALAGFAEAARRACARVADEGLELLYLTKTRQLNQIAFSADYIRRHGGRYGYSAGKDHGWKLEHGGEGSFLSYADPAKVANTDNLISYGPATRYPGSDIYRHPVPIEPLCLVKLVGNDDPDVNPPWQKRTYP